MRASVYPAGRGTGLTCVSRRAACSSAAEEEKSCPLLVFLPDKAGSTPVSQIFFFPTLWMQEQAGWRVPCGTASLYILAWVYSCFFPPSRSPRCCWMLLRMLPLTIHTDTCIQLQVLVHRAPLVMEWNIATLVSYSGCNGFAFCSTLTLCGVQMVLSYVMHGEQSERQQLNKER